MLKEKFLEVFGGEKEGLRVFRAPGRVNLIGEHTDYNGGYVFPAALTKASTVVLRKRLDCFVHIRATDLAEEAVIDLSRIENFKDLPYGNYQAGVMDEMHKAGYALFGMDMLFEDTVPHGSGLSSSAAIEVVTALAVYTLSREAGIGKEASMADLAKIAQRAENQYIGVNCGIMDQFASAMGKKDMALLLNCKTLEYELVPAVMEGYCLVLSNTKKKHTLGASKYNERRQECDNAFAALSKVLPDKTCLGDITPEEFEANKQAIDNETEQKRAQHVIYEDARVLAAVEALKKNDLITFGKLLNASHDSLRDDYEVTGTELDTMVEEARKIEGVLGSRMTGAGFGGCTVSIVRNDMVEEFKKTVGENYTRRTGLVPEFYISEIGNGAEEVPFRAQ